MSGNSNRADDEPARNKPLRSLQPFTRPAPALHSAPARDATDCECAAFLFFIFVSNFFFKSFNYYVYSSAFSMSLLSLAG